MLEMLLNLQPQDLTQGKAKESGEKQTQLLLEKLGLGQVEEEGLKDFLSLLKDNQNALTQKELELAFSGKEMSGDKKDSAAQSLFEKLGLTKQTGEGKASVQTDEAAKLLGRLRSHGPELSQGPGANKSSAHIQKPHLMSAEDFLGQKQLKSGDPAVAAQSLNSQVNAQMMQKYQNGQKVMDRQLVSFKTPSSEVTAEGALKSPIELEGDAGIIKLAQAPRAVGVDGKTIDMGKPQALDIGKMDMSKPQQVIDKIVEYIDKAQFDRTQKLDLVVKHEKLGQFQMQVSKSTLNAELIDLKIQAQGAEAHNFFKEHEIDLMKALTKNGVRLGEFKLTQSSEGSSLSQNSDSNKESQTGQGQKFSQSQDSDKDQANKDSQRRKTLWEQYQERYGA